MSRNIFITGTGTDVGKTYVTGLIVKKLRESGADAAYYKAAMSGNERRPDIFQILPQCWQPDPGGRAPGKKHVRNPPVP